MIRTLFNIMGFTSARVELQAWADEEHTEKNQPLNENIELLSLYRGAIGTNHRGTYLDVETSRSIATGDMILLCLSYSKGEVNIPKGFEVVMSAHHSKDPNVVVCYKKYNGESPIIRITKHSKNLIVSGLTLRGADIVVDSAGRIDTDDGDYGDAVTPRIKTADDGCLVSVFAYGDPLAVSIKDQINLVSLANDGKGFALGISTTDGSVSKRIRASSSKAFKGSGNDVAVAVSLY